MTTKTVDACGLCGVGEVEHRESELAGRIMHKHSSDGEQLAAVEPKPAQQNNRPFVTIPDVPLRALLLDKGLIAYDELVAKEVELLGRKRAPERS